MGQELFYLHTSHNASVIENLNETIVNESLTSNKTQKAKLDHLKLAL